MADEREGVRKSVEYRAMSLEVRVAQVLAASGWETAHSAWYRDARDQKEREIDVDAVRRWQWQRGDTIDYVHLHILAECKSVRGGQILFARNAGVVEDTLYHHWLDADDDATRERLFQLLVRGGVNDRAAGRALRRFHEAAYPDGQKFVAPLIPASPPAVNRVSEGQEIHSKREYLWEASQSVYGAIESTSSELFELSLNEVRDAIPHEAGEQRVIDGCVEAMLSEAATLTLFHPVVVTDAHLWAFDPESEPEPVESCRVTQTRIATRLWRWIDVVHEDELTAWAERATQWYADVFANVPPGRGSPAATSFE